MRHKEPYGEGDREMKERFGRVGMSAWLLVLIVATLVVAAIGGCAAQTAQAHEAKDNGNQVTLQKGQTLTVKLEGNPTTGYTWEMVEPEGAILRQVGEPEFNADSDLLGAPGTLTLRFQAVEAGQMDLRLVYHRPWETGVEPLETFTVQVTIQ
jgi:inhibitor of cysteine peptidase